MDILSWQTLILFAAALFLPLFPLTMVFNVVFQRLHNVWARAFLFLAWPLPGIWLLSTVADDLPEWVMFWALFSAALYAFRAIVVREAGIWSGFVATSAWSLVWVAYGIGAASGAEPVAPVAQALLLQAMAFSMPLMVMALLVSELEKRYESAYAGIVSGVAQAQPRLSGLLVIVMLAVIGSPVFPAFFSMLHSITAAIAGQPMLATGVAAVWLMWSWSAIRLLQDLLVGPAPRARHEDISQGALIIYGTLLVMLVVAGIYIARVLL